MKLTFYGGARIVSGANYLLEEDGTRILIDCGLFQGPNYCERKNYEPFPYEPKSIDAVLATHAHIDHTGRLPKLYKDGFRGRIFSTPPTAEFAEHLLVDSEHILNKESNEKNLAPLYSVNDVAEAAKIWEGVKYHKKFAVKNLEIEFFDAGHILGSSFILITSKISGKKIVFSGDLGNVSTPLVKDTENMPEADYAVIESTYGNRLHEGVEARKDAVEDLIEEIVKNKGVLLIPAFAMERTQELLYDLNELVENGRVPKVAAFIDSPLAIKLTGVYEKYYRNSDYFDKEAVALMKKGDEIFNFPGLKFTLTSEQSKEINSAPSPKVIIAGSGMSQGGRILHHEMRYLSGRQNAILFIGYQGQGSLGRQILDGAKAVKIFGAEIPVRCSVRSISGYSAHADRAKLLNWLSPQRAALKKVFVVQGEDDQSLPLTQRIEDELAVETMAPFEKESYML